MNLLESSRSISYYNSVRLSLDYLINHFGIHCSIGSIKQKEIEQFLLKLQQKGKTGSHSYQSGNGYEVYYRNIKAAFNKAKEWNYIEENYFTKVKLPKRQKLAPIFINSDQLLVICDWIKSEVVKDVVVFAFYTGMRLDEIVNLRWKNIDNESHSITVGDETFVTKGRKQRFIPICEEVAEIFLRRQKSEISNKKLLKTTASIVTYPGLTWLKHNEGDPSTVRLSSPHASLSMTNGYVFCKENGERFSGNYFSRRFKVACKAAGLDKSIHFHSLRHSFASNLAQRGVSIYTIKELLGHSSITTTQIYSHLNMESLREAVEKLAPRYEAQGSKYEVKEKSAEGRIPSSPLKKCTSSWETNEVKIFRINSTQQ